VRKCSQHFKGHIGRPGLRTASHPVCAHSEHGGAAEGDKGWLLLGQRQEELGRPARRLRWSQHHPQQAKRHSIHGHTAQAAKVCASKQKFVVKKKTGKNTPLPREKRRVGSMLCVESGCARVRPALLAGETFKQRPPGFSKPKLILENVCGQQSLPLHLVEESRDRGGGGGDVEREEGRKPLGAFSCC